MRFVPKEEAVCRILATFRRSRVKSESSHHDCEAVWDNQVIMRKGTLPCQNIKAKGRAHLLLSFNIDSHPPYNLSNLPALNIFPPSSTIVSPLTCPLALLLR
jgi:hypothetical protein